MAKPPPPFHYQKQFPLGKDQAEYHLLTDEFVNTVDFDGGSILKIEPQALTYLAETAMKEIAFKLRTKHLEQVAAISVLPTSGVRVLEVPTNRKADKLALGELLSSV